jgi:hypothetical protein
MSIEEKIQDKLRAVETDYLSKVEAAAHIKRDTRTLDRWFALGQGPPVTLISGRRYYDKKKFLRWLIEREQKPVRRAAAKGVRQ